jgi:MFS family permease
MEEVSDEHDDDHRGRGSLDAQGRLFELGADSRLLVLDADGRVRELGAASGALDVNAGVRCGRLDARRMTTGSSEGAATRRLLAPLRARPFRRLVLGRGFSTLGDWLLIAGLVGWVYGRTHSTAHVAVLMLVRLLPPIAGNLFAGSLADRYSRRRLLVLSEVACGAAVSGALVGVVMGSELVVFLCAGMSFLLGPIGAVAQSALLPDLVPDANRIAANATLTIAMEVAMASGALAAGVTLGAGAAALALAIDVVSFGAAAVWFAGIPMAPRVVVARPGRDGIAAGLRYLRSHRVLFVTGCAFALITLATGLTNASLPRFLAARGLGAGGYGYGLAAIAIGSAIGDAALGSLLDRVDLRTLGLSTLASCVPFGLLAVAPTGLTAIVALGVLGAVQGAGEVAVAGIVQQEAAPEFRGRAFGVVTTMNRLTMLSAVAAAPLVNAVASPRVAIVASTAIVAVSALVSLGHGRKSHLAAEVAQG